MLENEFQSLMGVIGFQKPLLREFSSSPFAFKTARVLWSFTFMPKRNLAKRKFNLGPSSNPHPWQCQVNAQPIQKLYVS